ncbi:uncharacterized protein LOC123693591 isoform X1 [Colias croceus]|uniref:uncharacterized protein LOC123693591 isoform X1 n=1 Tax=Colias crocea TaxID=72248 RepID=UPI001E281A9A|nr:uncharacterized protein LOC123693591 isoform X1 [Colias croceus]XP_045494711.1 uncharacterized protein LOC123693591 isoform X1 [Colias croceus]XP_045494712.1 uncharacterized protein LOC123693591 isoform X1 [Colias croceus]
MHRLEAILCLLSVVGTMGFRPHGSIGGEDHFTLTEAWLREVVSRMGKDFNDGGTSYLEFPPNDRQLNMMARANKEQEHEQLDYESLVDGNPNPSLRDQEYLQHSSLWGHQYVTGGASEVVPNHQVIKTDAVLPAYCNPPNPCPVGYTEEQGCISEFENTAAFSREYQLSQRCMCDGEHMFSCPEESSSDLDLHFPDPHKNLVAKKFQPEVSAPSLFQEIKRSVREWLDHFYKLRMSGGCRSCPL